MTPASAPVLTRREAVALLRREAPPLEVVTVPLERARGLACARDLPAVMELPGFDRSALDGYGVRAADTAGAAPARPARLAVGREVRPSAGAQVPLEPGACVRLLTGGPLPPGCDAVLRDEDAVLRDGFLLADAPVAPGAGVQARGADLPRGSLVLARGNTVTPAAAALLAETGVLEVPVYRSPRVRVLVVGNELRDPAAPAASDPASPHAIPAGNLVLLRDLLAAHGAGPVRCALVRNDPTSLAEAVAQARDADLLLCVGGMGRGDRDHTRMLFASRGTMLFAGLAMTPAKGTALARLDGVPALGLPGMPWGVFAAFHAVVLPALRALSGRPEPEAARALLRGRAAARPGMERLLLSRWERRGASLEAEPLDRALPRGTALLRADCYAAVPPGSAPLETGSEVEVLPLAASSGLCNPGPF
jgi:molybdopterin biosynthesis enzyme